MSYRLQDLYTASGAAKLYGCWNESVVKHSPGNFYNYEQDNIPILDLEERTDFLWEQLGYPTSSVPGMVLVVSADADPEAVTCNSNIFLDVSSAVAAIPKFIDAPVILELASYGYLGELSLKDITCGPNGSLEIINRLAFDPYFGDGKTIPIYGTNRVSTGPHAGYGTIWKDCSGASITEAQSIFSCENGYQPSSLLLEGPIFSATYPALDMRVSGSMKAFYGTPSYQPVREFSRLSVADWVVADGDADGYYSFAATVYEEGATDIEEYDPSSFKQHLGHTLTTEVYRVNANDSYADKELKFVAYANYFDKVNIYNVNGPAYLRGIHCSGLGTSAADVGVHVVLSNVSFENLAVEFFTDAGIKIENSKVGLLRNLFVYRCYGLDDNGNRKSGLWETNRKQYDIVGDDSAGIKAFDSILYFDPVYSHLSQWFDYQPARDILRVIARNSTGLKLVNSVLLGGSTRDPANMATSAAVNTLDILNIEGNANYGIFSENSTIEYAGRIELVNNTRGLRCIGGVNKVQESAFENNHVYGVFATNSDWQPNHLAVSATDRLDFTDLAISPIKSNPKHYSQKFWQNGQHIVAHNSNIKATHYPTGLAKYYGRTILYEAHGVSDDTENHLLPGVELVNSECELVNVNSFRSGVDSMAALGAHILASDGSRFESLGTVSSINCFLGGSGTPTYNEMKRYATIAADKGSTLVFRGPNIIYDGAVNLLADHNSHIVFEPHKKASGQLGIEEYELLDPRAHTQIELKGYKACLVADKGSSILMTDLGDIHQYWTPEQLSGTNYSTCSTDLNFETYVSGGFMQIYANPNNYQDYESPAGVAASVLATRGSQTRMSQTGDQYYWGSDPYTSDPFALGEITQGGLCLRALNSSHVKVRNVHFPCGFWNPSSIIYDTSAADEYCSRLFIWNIASDSTLVADHISVSSLYPADAGYHGPSGVWLSGANNDVAYAAPSSTPDTSSLSVLDYFGIGALASWPLNSGEMVIYGQTSHLNQGPFRLYVSVDSLATKLYHYDSFPGLAYQAFAQGYNVSGDLIADSAVSALYGKVLRYDVDGNLSVTGFHFGNEYVNVNPTNILLDESAANTFANAKNGAMGTSNRPQICTIFDATTFDTGEAKDNSDTSLGRGFRSLNIFDLLEEH